MNRRMWLPLLWVVCLCSNSCIRTPNANLIVEYKQCMDAGMWVHPLYNDQGISGYQCVPPQSTENQAVGIAAKVKAQSPSQKKTLHHTGNIVSSDPYYKGLCAYDGTPQSTGQNCIDSLQWRTSGKIKNKKSEDN